MPNDRLITAAEKSAMENLSIGILDLCEQSGMKDNHLIVNAAIIGFASVVASTIPDTATESIVHTIAKQAGIIVTDEIISSHQRFVRDIRAAAKPKN